MNIPEFTDALGAQLSKLSTYEVMLFALSICNRLVPHYLEFYEQNLWGNPSLLSETLRLCETVNFTDTNRSTTLLGLNQQLEEIIPDTEEFEDGSLALNASASVLELVEFVLDRDLDHILNISSYMIDTVDFIAREAGVTEVTEATVTEKLLQEMTYQLELTKTDSH